MQKQFQNAATRQSPKHRENTMTRKYHNTSTATPPTEHHRTHRHPMRTRIVLHFFLPQKCLAKNNYRSVSFQSVVGCFRPACPAFCCLSTWLCGAWCLRSCFIWGCCIRASLGLVGVSCLVLLGPCLSVGPLVCLHGLLPQLPFASALSTCGQLTSQSPQYTSVSQEGFARAPSKSITQESYEDTRVSGRVSYKSVFHQSVPQECRPKSVIPRATYQDVSAECHSKSVIQSYQNVTPRLSCQRSHKTVLPRMSSESLLHEYYRHCHSKSISQKCVFHHNFLKSCDFFTRVNKHVGSCARSGYVMCCILFFWMHVSRARS